MKRLIVCCDGTWNTPEMASPTNVVRMAQAIEKSGPPDHTPQIVYYDEGVGTGGIFDKFIGGGFGEGIDINIQQAYRFLANNYEPEDEIYLFGFSRGAYTVRSLGGMIGVAGLLQRHQITLVTEAYELYRSKPTSEIALRFRARHGTDELPQITVMGCWDTVGALGLPDKLPWLDWDSKTRKRYGFVDNRLGGHIRYGFHAVAIDERRREFDYTAMRRTLEPGRSQVVNQTWFPGDHGSVGGGTEHKEPLSRAALEWMVEGIHAAGLQLKVDLSRIHDLQQRDHNSYFSANRSVIYSTQIRKLDRWPRFHQSALARFNDLPNYRSALGTQQRQKLAAAAAQGERSLRLPETITELAPGQLAHAVVLAEKRRNRTKIKLLEQGRYRIRVAPTQTWQDGDLPPCGATGWNIESPDLKGVFDSMLSAGKKPLIRLGRKYRVIADADWFVLCGEISAGRSHSEPFAIGDGSHLPANGLKPPATGELVLFSNDLSSRIDFIDKYDNNAGWLVVEVERLR